MYGAILGDIIGSPFEFDKGNDSVDPWRIWFLWEGKGRINDGKKYKSNWEREDFLKSILHNHRMKQYIFTW